MVEGTLNKSRATPAKPNDSGFICVYFKNCKRGGSSWNFTKFIDNRMYRKSGFATAREAAVALDRCLIADGHEPINVFKRV